MKYKINQYAEALVSSIEEKQKIDTHLVRNLVRVLSKNGDYAKLPAILREAENLYIKRQGLEKLKIESASPLSEETVQSIQKTLPRGSHVITKVNPKLLGGLTLLVNDSLFIDASAKTRLEKLFHKS
jgi:F0F1-type ATP synthase delta subunit